MELLKARLAFGHLSVRDISKLNENASKSSKSATGASALHVQRIAYVLPRISTRLPWRSDCLIQAMAGQRWLLASGLPSQINIGVEKPGDGGFGSHAWLMLNEKVITGGDVGRYRVMLGEETGSEASD
ncbi:lasso peptide biosynthesis B2 protein [Erythrobacter sp. THAF29]|uniref:lasso peptide biosynthesis B2 protein n=1 Tax=Erythrobacter sp. THAF29 TaxID=2587851 RepID=UPI001562A8E2|nr:lasso peptide biosynthesis B2 protein [Erythrobacter sp. THAF29]